MSEFSGFQKVKDGIFRFSRSLKRAQNNLGIVSVNPDLASTKYRKGELELFDSYFENRQYAHLMPWSSADASSHYVPVRNRKPLLSAPFAKNLSQRLGSKLIGSSVFPTIKCEDFPDDAAYLKQVISVADLKFQMMEPIRRMTAVGSVLIRFYLVDGTMKVEWYLAKYCYPEFLPNGELSFVRVQYVYPDMDDRDERGNPKKKWYRIDLGMDSEFLYDNPEFREREEPVFNVVNQLDHGLGFVQAEWFRTCEQQDSIDGVGFVEDIMDFIDEFNYSLSQSSKAVSYNQDPQLVFNKMTEGEQEAMIRSVTKSWNLGREGDAKFLESNLTGVSVAEVLRTTVRTNIADLSRIVMLDPEKIVGSAQSAKAMEVLHGPMKDLIDELRLPTGKHFLSLVLKMGTAIYIAKKRGIDVPINIPNGYVPQFVGAETDWPPIFQQTMEDLQKKVSVANMASTSNIISRRRATTYLAKDFGIEDVDAEIAEVNSQPNLNPFGGF